jgi:GntR family transcriptional regulator of vanillate catabolism
MRAPPEGPSSQTVNALLKLRELILGGEIKAGERMSELLLVERLGVSRTPIRAALVRLEQEGLLRALPSGGFVVDAFNERDIHAAIEIRGTLEGLAARLAAERGVAQAHLEDLRHCLSGLDELVLASGVTVDSFSAYVELNEQFHRIIVDLADSAVLSRQIARAVSLPFASASAFVMVQARLPEGKPCSRWRRIIIVASCARSRRARVSAQRRSCASTPAWRAGISSSRCATGRRADSCRARISSLF